MSSFKKDVIVGLSADKKFLLSKYFYDEIGSRLFQEIMHMEEYYLPGCEKEIITHQSVDIVKEIQHQQLDIIELGAGDGSKSVLFLDEFVKSGINLNYLPFDISEDILQVNKTIVSASIPDLPIEIVPGDYFDTINMLKDRKLPKLIMFMGSNIGNFKDEKAIEFIEFVNSHLEEGDYFLMGVDLKKNPHVIRAAYNDKEGITKRFNINLLERINRELQGDFNLDAFEHYGVYNPNDGAALSFLVSLEEQTVSIDGNKFEFEKYETIHTEVSQKYSLKDLNRLAMQTGFSWFKHFTDSKNYYSLSLFRK